MKTPFTKDFWQIDNLRTTWEYKSVAFILRAAVCLTVCMYVILTAPSVWTWVQAEYVRQQPIASFESILDTAIAHDDFNGAARWLRFRPKADHAVIAAHLDSNISYIPAPFVIFASQAETVDDPGKVAFWHLLARYRLRFDVIRCGQPELVKKINSLQQAIIVITDQKNVLEEIEKDPARMADALQEVLDFDAKHPARNSPVYTCALVKALSRAPQRVAVPEVWPTIRHTLRLTTESGIAALKADAASNKKNSGEKPKPALIPPTAPKAPAP